jgi:hypothetical protein
MMPNNTTPSARAVDPGTSHAAAASMAKPSRGQRAALLAVYRSHPGGLTDEEACVLAVIPGGWKRCSELRAAGLIRETGRTRPGASGREQRVCEAVITDIPASLFPTPKGGFRW